MISLLPLVFIGISQAKLVLTGNWADYQSVSLVINQA